MLTSTHLLYAFLSISAAALSFLKLGYLASILSEESFGIYSLILISYVYIGYIGSLGSNEYLLKVGASFEAIDNDMLSLTRNNALFYGYVGVLIICFFTMAANYFSIFPKNDLVLISVVAIAFFTYPYNIFESYYRAKQKVLFYSGMLFLKSLFVFTGVYIFVDDFGLNAAIYSEIFSLFLISTVVFFLNFKDITSSSLDKMSVALRAIVSNGLNVCMSNMCRNIALAIDRFAVVFLFGLSSFGIYSFVMILYQAAILFSAIVMNALGPRLIRIHKENKCNSKLTKIIFAISSGFFVVAALFFPIFHYLAPSFIINFFSKYHSSSLYLLLDIAYWACVISVIIFIMDWFFICISKEYYITIFSFFSFIVACCAIAIFKFFEISLVGFIFLFFSSKLLILIAMVFIIKNNRV